MQNQEPISVNAPALIPAETGVRIVAYLIDLAPALVLGFIPIVGSLAVLAWIVCRDLAFGGQSLGKKAMGLKVVDFTTGATAQPTAMIIRNAVLIIPCFALVELVVYFAGNDKRRLGDKWSNCAVIAA